MTGNDPDVVFRPRGLVWILWANIVNAIDYSMIMPTGWEYITELGGDNMYYGFTVAIFPIGRILFLVMAGYVSDRRGFRLPFIGGTMLCILGDLVYGSASATGKLWVAPLGRFIAGCGATQPLSAWAARSYPPKQRVQIESLQKASALIGVVIGPALNGLVTKLDGQYGPFKLNPLTCAGYVPALCNLILLFGFMFFVDEPPPQRKSTGSLTPSSARTSFPYQRLISSGSWLCLLIAFHTNIQMSALDTILSPLTESNLGWDLMNNSLLFAVIAVVCAVGAVSGILANRWGMKPMKIIFVGSIANLLCAAVMTGSISTFPKLADAQMFAFLVSGGVVAFSVLSYGGAAGGVYQQACGDAQGVLGGLYTMFFSLGRPVGSMLAGLFLQGTSMPLVVAVPSGVLVCLVLQVCIGHRLQNAEDQALTRGASLREKDPDEAHEEEEEAMISIIRSISCSSVQPPQVIS